VLVTCSEVEIEGKLESKGGASETIKQGVKPENVKWRKCSLTMDTIKGGEIEIHHIAGTDNGTVILRGIETTALIFGATCAYSYGTGTDVGYITGGPTPVMHIKGVLPKSAGSFICPQEITGETEGVLTAPKEAGYIEDE
jgi:hypothetical protein